MELLKPVVDFIWALPLGLIVWEIRNNRARLLKLEQEHVPRPQIKELIKEKVSPLEDSLNTLVAQNNVLNQQMMDMRLDFTRWQERLAVKLEDK